MEDTFYYKLNTPKYRAVGKGASSSFDNKQIRKLTIVEYDRKVEMGKEGHSPDILADTNIDFGGSDRGFLLHDMSHVIVGAYFQALGIKDLRLGSLANEILLSPINYRFWQNQIFYESFYMKFCKDKQEIKKQVAYDYCKKIIPKKQIQDFMRQKVSETGSLEYSEDNIEICNFFREDALSLSENKSEAVEYENFLNNMVSLSDDLAEVINQDDQITVEKWSKFSNETLQIESLNVELLKQVKIWEWIVAFLEGRTEKYYDISELYSNTGYLFESETAKPGVEILRSYIESRNPNFHDMKHTEKSELIDKELTNPDLLKEAKYKKIKLRYKFNKSLPKDVSLKYAVSRDILPKDLVKKSAPIVQQINELLEKSEKMALAS